MTKGRLLYVEDDDALSFVTKDSLEVEGFAVTHCTDGETAKKSFKNENYDLCLIDVMLPLTDGFALASYIRNVNSQIPILFVTAKSMKEDKIKGLKIGADDYITKPFSIEELVLKINIFLKRKYVNEEFGSVEKRIGEYRFDFSNLTLKIGEDVIKLTQREGELLNLLTNHHGEIIKRKDLLERIWGREDYFLGRSMDVFISRLRKYLSKDPSIKIENVHGVGFRLSND
jgi:DNA-binding response OmpR family regulator